MDDHGGAVVCGSRGVARAIGGSLLAGGSRSGGRAGCSGGSAGEYVCDDAGPTEIIGTPIAFTPISGISGMKSERFTAGQLWIERNRRREGPPVVYTVLCGKSARPFTDPKAILKWVKWPKSTPTGDALREWLASFEKKAEAPAPELDMAKIKAEGFGPEAHDDDPTANTKMVT